MVILARKGGRVVLKILDNLTSLGLNNHGILIRNSEDNTLYPDGSLADYYGVIRRSKLNGFSGIIIEHAFVTNKSDASFMGNEDNLKRWGMLMHWVLHSIMDYQNLFWYKICRFLTRK